jgi:aspartate 1-decarboxylase
MLISMFKSTILRATVTQAELNYVGSVTIDRDLIDAAGLRVYEQVDVLNINNGARFTTYVIEGERGSGTICLNGACARLAAVGDLVIVVSYAQMTPEEADKHRPRTVHVDARNGIMDVVNEVAPLFSLSEMDARNAMGMMGPMGIVN